MKVAAVSTMAAADAGPVIPKLYIQRPVPNAMMATPKGVEKEAMGRGATDKKESSSINK
jgi:hypothetical protein